MGNSNNSAQFPYASYRNRAFDKTCSRHFLDVSNPCHMHKASTDCAHYVYHVAFVIFSWSCHVPTFPNIIRGGLVCEKKGSVHVGCIFVIWMIDTHYWMGDCQWPSHSHLIFCLSWWMVHLLDRRAWFYWKGIGKKMRLWYKQLVHYRRSSSSGPLLRPIQVDRMPPMRGS